MGLACVEPETPSCRSIQLISLVGKLIPYELIFSVIIDTDGKVHSIGHKRLEEGSAKAVGCVVQVFYGRGDFWW